MTGEPQERADDTASSAAQQVVTKRYDRMAPLYDIYTGPMELLGMTRRRRRLLSRAVGSVLEIGVGTGQNLSHYPRGVRITGIDISESMLSRARKRASVAGRSIELRVADAHQLPFEDGEFDTVVATSVFCSVADPIAALREARRVTSSDGQILLLEHVRPESRLFGFLADRVNGVASRVFGFNVNRRTEHNVAAAGMEIVDVRRNGIWREMVAASRGRRVDDDVTSDESQS